MGEILLTDWAVLAARYQREAPADPRRERSWGTHTQARCDLCCLGI